MAKPDVQLLTAVPATPASNTKAVPFEKDVKAPLKDSL